jgi:hypothetical protein
MKPIIFFYDNHIDGGTIEILNEVLPLLISEGYEHICFEEHRDFIVAKKEAENLFKSQTDFFPSSHKLLFNLPHASGLNIASAQLSNIASFELYRMYHIGIVVKLFQTIQNNPRLIFHPIDNLVMINKGTFSPEREQAMVDKIADVVRSNPMVGVVVFCGLGHYRMEQSLKNQLPQLPIVAFHASENTWLKNLPLSDLDDVFAQKVISETLMLRDGEQKILANLNLNVKIRCFKLSMFSEQQVYNTIKNMLSPHELLLFTVENYLQCNPRDSSVLPAIKNREYSKTLRMACNAGRVELVKILLEWVSILNIKVSEKNKDSLSAIDYAEKYAKEHPQDGENAWACYQQLKQ